MSDQEVAGEWMERWGLEYGLKYISTGWDPDAHMYFFTDSHEEVTANFTTTKERDTELNSYMERLEKKALDKAMQIEVEHV
jgi:hypothetical protein